jgi:hypothetical protein
MTKYFEERILNMNRTSALLIASAALGMLADVLLRAELWGINVPLGLIPFAAVMVWLQTRSDHPLAAGWRYTIAAWLTIVMLLAWHAAPMLQAANILFFITGLVMTVARPPSGSLRTATASDAGYALGLYGLHAVVGPVFLLAGELKRSTPSPSRSMIAIRVAKGAALAIPPLILFTMLFMAADPVFDHGVRTFFGIDIETVASHLFITAVVAWLIAGALRGRFLAEPVSLQVKSLPQMLRLGLLEISIVLGVLIALFALFLAVQFRYLFGGASLVGVVPDLTYAQYARSGFFELVTAAAIVLPFILMADWLLVPSAVRDRTIFRILAGVLVLEVFVLMTSALQRMHLYQQEFGLTELRFFVTACMLWLALMFVVFLATVLRGRRHHFLSAGFAVSFLFLLVLNAANPEDWIVRTNLARASEGKRFDARYNASLSEDAIPALVQHLPSLGEADRTEILKGLSRHHQQLSEADWRSWTYSRSVARRILSRVPFSGDTTSRR